MYTITSLRIRYEDYLTYKANLIKDVTEAIFDILKERSFRWDDHNKFTAAYIGFDQAGGTEKAIVEGMFFDGAPHGMYVEFMDIENLVELLTLMLNTLDKQTVEIGNANRP